MTKAPPSLLIRGTGALGRVYAGRVGRSGRDVAILGAVVVVLVELAVAWVTQAWFHLVLGGVVALGVAVALTIDAPSRRISRPRR